MWNLPKGDDFLPNVGLQKLQRMYREEHGAKAKVRLLCAVHRKEGESLDAIVRMANVSRTTAHDILHRFVERGIDGKDGIKQTGRPARLTETERKKLIEILERGPPHNKSGLWTTKEVREYIRKEFGVEYTVPHVWELLKVAGFSIQKPRPRHYKAPGKAEISTFKKRLAGWRALTEKKVSSLPAKTRQRLD